jgi:hypothetical protein
MPIAQDDDTIDDPVGDQALRQMKSSDRLADTDRRDETSPTRGS